MKRILFLVRPQNWCSGLAILVILLVQVTGNGLAEPLQSRVGAAGQALPLKVFLPLITSPSLPQVMLGVYTEDYLGVQSTLDNEVKAIDTWGGKRNSIVGTFIAIEDQNPSYNIPVPLGLIWDNGYTPFVNLETSKTLAQINSGSLDTQIRAMADAFVTWRNAGLAKSQNRRAFLAPLQEMNGYWVTYHDNDPTKFKAAFKRIQDIFAQRGASSAVRWVFAPNGWSDPSDPPFESYYPGDSAVEALAFSSYNSGYCSSATWKVWDTPQTVFQPYIQRMRVMAPSKGIIVAQTGTTAYTQTGYNEIAKADWMHTAYDLLASDAGVIGIIYFNKAAGQTCDWAFYLKNGLKISSYSLAVANPNFNYISPEILANKNLAQ